MPYQDREHIKKSPAIYKTFVGLASGTVATSLVHPYDLLKTRMQLSNRNVKMVSLAKCIVKHEGGYGSLYKGLTAALARNVTNTSVRLGAFYTLSERYRKNNEKASTGSTVANGVVAGALGAVVGNPAELVLVRMMGDGTQGRSCPCQPVRYTSICDGIKKITACEGKWGLWRGANLSILRSVIISGSQIYAYTKTKQMIEGDAPAPKKKTSDKKSKPVAPKTGSLMLHLVTAMVTSFCTAFLSLPVDLVKTWYQYLSPDPCCTPSYVFKNVVKCRSFLFLWKGFLPYYLRMCTHTFITFLLLDKLCSAYETGAINPLGSSSKSSVYPKKWTPWD